jgi:DNA polymerase III subunit delta
MAATKQSESNSSVYLVAGDDDYLIDQKARTLVDQLCPKEEQALGLEIIEGAIDLVEEAVHALAQCMEAVRTVGFFGGRKVVWLRNASFFSDGMPGKSEEVKSRVEGLTRLIKDGLPEGQVLIISAQKVDGRTAFYKACKAAAEIIEFKTPDKPAEAEASARSRVDEIWATLKLRPADDEAVELFLQRVGPDTRRLMQESEKLAAYMGRDRPPVTAEDVRAVVSAGRESIAWDLADHVGLRRLGPALLTLRQLLFQRESPVGLIIGLEHRFRELALLKECMRRKWLRREGSGRYQKAVWTLDAEGEAALAQFPRDPRKIHWFRLAKLSEQAAAYSLRELLDAQELLAQTHEQMVSSSVPQDLALEFLLIRLAAGGAGARAAS